MVLLGIGSKQGTMPTLVNHKTAVPLSGLTQCLPTWCQPVETKTEYNRFLTDLGLPGDATNLAVSGNVSY